MDKVFKIWTDGSCAPNPGAGGWAVVGEDCNLIISGAKAKSTNIEMEGIALVYALKIAEKYINKYNNGKVIVHSDSQFWINVVTKWAPNWARSGWKKKSKDEIKNLNVVKVLHKLYSSLNGKAELQWVKAHVGHAQNEAADHWANEARKNSDKI